MQVGYSNIQGIYDMLVRATGYSDQNLQSVSIDLAKMYFDEHKKKMLSVFGELQNTLHIHNIYMRGVLKSSADALEFYRNLYEYYQYLAHNGTLVYIKTADTSDVLVYLNSSSHVISNCYYKDTPLTTEDLVYSGLSFGNMMDRYALTPSKWAPGKTLLKFYDDLEQDFHNVYVDTPMGRMVFYLGFKLVDYR
jgi:hypothetical protein